MKEFFSNKYIRIFGILFLLILSILFIPFYKGTSLTKIIQNRVEYLGLSEERQADYDKMKIEYLNIKSRVTGTAPFNTGDESNTDGVDVTDSDDYVRTFDVMKYTIEVGIGPNTSHDGVTTSSVYEGGVIKVRAKLPNQGSPTLMRWEQDAWMQNVQYSNDKTEIYAEYHVPSGVSITNANQNLTFTVKVDGYKKEVTSEMAPEFEVWMEGNKPDDNTSSASSVTEKDTRNIIISGQIWLDTTVVRHSERNFRGLRNDVTGQYMNFGIGVSLRQPVSNFNDLRGVCFPSGPVELEISSNYQYRIRSSSDDYASAPNISSVELVEYGLNREPKPNYYLSAHNAIEGVPCGRYGLNGANTASNNKFCVYDSGDFSLTLNNATYLAQFENYQLNSSAFPLRNVGSSADTPVTTTGKILASNMQIFVPYYDFDSNIDYDYQYIMNITKVKYQDLQGNLYEMDASNETVTSNNRAINTFYKSNGGNITGRVRLYTNNLHQSEESSSSIGTIIKPRFQVNTYDGPYLGGTTRFITWNSRYVTFDNSITTFCSTSMGFKCPTFNGVTYQYGILRRSPDTGLVSLDEINHSSDEDFDWYATTEEALSHGKIAAVFVDDPVPTELGILREFILPMKIDYNEDYIGQVIAFYQKIKVYDDVARTQVRELYPTATFRQAVYREDGSLVSASSPRTIGASCLITGARASTTISVTDQDFSGNQKSAYDVQDSEIHLSILPQLITGTDISDNDIYADSVLVIGTLPNGLSYHPGSANKEPKSVLVNADGTTTITWEYNNWQVNREAPEYPEITFTADISASLNNNTSLLLTSNIQTSLDLSDDSKMEANYKTSEYGVIISNLAGSKAIKEIDKPVVEKNESFSVTSTLGNNSEEVLSNVKTIEILPVNNDENGSKFSGSYTSKVTTGISGQRFFYTTGNISNIGLTEDRYGKITIKDVDLGNDSRWIEVNVGEVIPNNATAIATSLPELASQSEESFVMEFTPTGNKEEDTYAFTLNMTTDNLQAAIKTNTVVTKVVARSLSGKAFVDENRNGVYDDGDSLLKTSSVKLLNESGSVIKTTQTNNAGEYSFENLDKANYYVEFSIPENYETIAKGTSSKVNTNGRTDKITELNVVPSTSPTIDVTGIDMGIQKIAAKIYVRYEEYGNSTNLFDSTSFDKFYGDTYNLDNDYTPNIPDNYELKEKTNNYTGTVNQNEITIIYYYQKKDSTLTSSIDKTGTNEITSREDNVSYSITYKTKITDYLGNAVITTVDQLPYPIDLEHSTLDGGVYDTSSQTITWTETKTIGSISEPEIVIKKDIELLYMDIDSRSREMINTVEGTVTLDNNSRSVQDDYKTDIKIPGTIIVHYIEVDEEGNEIKDLIDPIETTDLVGEEYTSEEKEFEGYELVEKPENEEYEYLEEEQEVIYKYQKVKVKVETVVHGIGGKIEGDETVPYGDDSTKDKIIIDAEEGYQIESVKINGKEIEIKPGLKRLVVDNFEGMTEDKLVEVTFTKIPEMVNPETGRLIYFIICLIVFNCSLFSIYLLKHHKLIK